MFEIEYLCRMTQVLADKVRIRAHRQRRQWARQTLLDRMKDSGVVDLRRMSRLD